MGTVDYGIWAIAISLASYVQVADLVFGGLVGPCVLFVSASAAAFRRIPVGDLGSLKGMPAEILRLLRSGAEVQITSLAALALHPASRLLVSRFGGSSELVALDLSERAVLALRGVAVAVLAPAIPAAARAGSSLGQ